MNQGRQRKRERFDKMEKKWTNLAWPTPGDSDVPPAEEYTYLWLRGSGANSSRGNADRGDQLPWPPAYIHPALNDAITLTGHRESAGRDAIVRNVERRRERTPRPSLTAISLSFHV